MVFNGLLNKLLIWFMVALSLERVGFLYTFLYLERVRITRELNDVTVTTGEDAVFHCEVSQTGVTSIEWWLGSNHLQSNDLNQISSRGREHSLALKMVTPDDSGDVAFVVGCERTVASLVVKDKPKGKGFVLCKCLRVSSTTSADSDMTAT